MSNRVFLYFLCYLVFGPLVGYLLVVAGLLVLVAVTDWFPVIESMFQYHRSELVWMIAIAYVVGGLQAAATGIYAAKALAKNGKSNLRNVLLVAIAASVCVSLALILAQPTAYRLILALIPPTLISVAIIRAFERYFRLRDFQA